MVYEADIDLHLLHAALLTLLTDFMDASNGL
jgi:hypothetical protein